MSISRMGRFIVTLAALLFAGVGLQFWAVPEEAGYRFGLEAVHDGGVAALRSDVGGLFLGLAVMCGLAVWERRREWFLAAAVVLGAVAAGRSIDWIISGSVGVIELAIELSVIAALAVSVRSSTRSAARGSAGQSAPIVITSTVRNGSSSSPGNS